MTDLLSLFKTTGAYSSIVKDKRSGTLSHAYLLITPDSKNLDEYARIVAKIIVCEDGEPCLSCRKCRLIDANAFTDVKFYPKDAAVKTDDVNEIIEESFIKPIEGDKKVFIISHAETMSEIAQNKLLKTLEEPPNNVYIVVLSTSEFSLLSTFKSRVKKFEIPPYSEDALFSALMQDCPDEEKLRVAIAVSDGTVGGAQTYYSDKRFSDACTQACDVLINMKKSGDVLRFSNKVTALGDAVDEFLSVLLLALSEMLYLNEGKESLIKNLSFPELKNAEGFTRGSIIHAIETTNEAVKRKKANVSDQTVVEWLLLSILEGKHKWQKS